MGKIYRTIRGVVSHNMEAKNVMFWISDKFPFSVVYDWVYNRMYKDVIDTLKPKTLSLEPYNLCNLKCIMCPYKDMARPKIVMSMEMFEKILHDAKAFGIENINLSFYSEPFLDRHIFERISMAKRMGFRVTFYSNGMLMTNEKIRELLKNPPDEILFSFDGGTKETYEKIRVNSSFDVVSSNIMALYMARGLLPKPIITVVCTIQEENKNEIKQFRRKWQGIADNIDFGIVDNRGGRKMYGKKTKTVYPCPRLWSEIVVMSNGTFALCCVDYDGSVVLGDAKTSTVQDIWDSDKFVAIREMHKNKNGKMVNICLNCDKLYRSSRIGWLDIKKGA